VAVAGVHQRHAARKADLARPADLFERNLRLGFERRAISDTVACPLLNIAIAAFRCVSDCTAMIAPAL